MFHSSGNDLPDEFISDVVDVEAGSIATSLGSATGYIDCEAANPAGSGGQNQVADHIPFSPPDLRRAIERRAKRHRRQSDEIIAGGNCGSPLE
nr:hypothetical protein [Mycobacterium sp. Z3061]